MKDYTKLILASLPGETPEQKYESLLARERLFEKVLISTFVTPELRDSFREKWNAQQVPGEPSFTEAIELLTALVETIQYATDRSNGLNIAYHNAKDFLSKQV